MYIQRSCSPLIPLRLALKNPGQALYRLFRRCYHLESVTRPLSQQKPDPSRWRLSRPSHRRYYHGRPSQGYTRNKRALGGTNINSRGYRNTERHSSTQATDNEPNQTLGDSSSPTSTLQDGTYPEPYSKLTLSYARNILSLPSEGEYSALPGLSSTPKKALHPVRQWKLIEVDNESTGIGSIGAFHCKLVCRVTPIVDGLVRDPIEVAGVGSDEKWAERAAYLFLLAELHSRNLIGPICRALRQLRYGRGNSFDLREIYHFTSNLALVPQITYETLSDPKSSTHEWYEIKIELPDKKIKAVATEALFSKAMTKAAHSFLEQAKHYCANENVHTVINSSTPLTVANAQSLLSFYLVKRGKRSRFTTYSGIKRFGPVTVHFATLYMDGKPMSYRVMADSTATARSLARLAGAIHIINEDPSIWPEFVSHVVEGKGVYTNPVPLLLSDQKSQTMHNSIKRLSSLGILDQNEERPAQFTNHILTSLRSTKKSNAVSLEKSLDPRHSYRSSAELREASSVSPARKHAEQVLDTIKENTFSIIAGAAGTGKTTQIPQMILDSTSNANIVVTQPRKILAVSAAHRVATERGEDLGQSVGYENRFDMINPSSGRGITYCTAGVLLSRLLKEEDSALDTLSHIIIDEAHERDLPADFLLTTLQQFISRRVDSGKSLPKVIIMSDTSGVKSFSNYLKNFTADGKSVAASGMVIPDKSFPVHRHFLEDILISLFKSHEMEELLPLLSGPSTQQFISGEKILYSQDSTQGPGSDAVVKSKISEMLLDQCSEADRYVPAGLVAATISYICQNHEDGAILVILPGLEIIRRVEEELRRAPLRIDFNNQERFQILILHSELGDTNVDIFGEAKQGCRRIILSTNVVESTIDVPGIRYVIDGGKANDEMYDPSTGVHRLFRGWIDKSTSLRRQARAGQFENGHYYAMFTNARFDSFEDQIAPRTLRTDFQSECLQVKACSSLEPLRGFLSQMPDPPTPERIGATISNLKSLGALDSQENITSLGQLLTLLPLNLVPGKIILLGILFRCFEPAIILCASMHAKSMFVTAGVRRDKDTSKTRQYFANKSESDHISTLNAFNEIRGVLENEGEDAALDFCSRNSLNFSAFSTMKLFISDLMQTLHSLKLVPPTQEDGLFGTSLLNKNSDHIPVVKCLILAALSPNLATKSNGSPHEWQTRLLPRTVVTHKSANWKLRGDRAGELMTFSRMHNFHADSGVILLDTTKVSPLMACLFGRGLSGDDDTLFIDSNIPVKVKLESGRFDDNVLTANAVLELRTLFDEALAIEFGNLAAIVSINENDANMKSDGENFTSNIIADVLPDLVTRDPIAHRPRRQNVHFKHLNFQPDVKSNLKDSTHSDL